MVHESIIHQVVLYLMLLVFILHNSCGFLDEFMFSDETPFHISGKVKAHNNRIWGTEKPQEESRERESPTINVR